MVNITCSCLNVFLRLDLLEVPCDGFLRFLEVGFWPFIVALLLGSGLGLGSELGFVWHLQGRIRVLGEKVG